MFDIQRFADTVTSSSEGKLKVKFYDGDDRTITINDPKSNLDAAKVNTFVNWLKSSQAIIGDKTGASLVGAESFFITDKMVTRLDLS